MPINSHRFHSRSFFLRLVCPFSIDFFASLRSKSVRDEVGFVACIKSRTRHSTRFVFVWIKINDFYYVILMGLCSCVCVCVCYFYQMFIFLVTHGTSHNISFSVAEHNKKKKKKQNMRDFQWSQNNTAKPWMKSVCIRVNFNVHLPPIRFKVTTTIMTTENIDANATARSFSIP